MAQSFGSYGEEESLEWLRGICVYRCAQTSRQQVGWDSQDDSWKDWQCDQKSFLFHSAKTYQQNIEEWYSTWNEIWPLNKEAYYISFEIFEEPIDLKQY